VKVKIGEMEHPTRTLQQTKEDLGDTSREGEQKRESRRERRRKMLKTTKAKNWNPKHRHFSIISASFADCK
jgi:hypothetical protein